MILIVDPDEQAASGGLALGRGPLPGHIHAALSATERARLHQQALGPPHSNI